MSTTEDKMRLGELYQQLSSGKSDARDELIQEFLKLKQFKKAVKRKSAGSRLRAGTKIGVKQRCDHDELEAIARAAVVEASQNILVKRKTGIRDITAYLMTVVRSAMNKSLNTNSTVTASQQTILSARKRRDKTISNPELTRADREHLIRRDCQGNLPLRDKKGNVLGNTEQKPAGESFVGSTPKRQRSKSADAEMLWSSNPGPLADYCLDGPTDLECNQRYEAAVNKIRLFCCGKNKNREVDVVSFKACGMSNEEIALQIHRRTSTVRRLLQKIEMEAVARGFLPPSVTITITDGAERNHIPACSPLTELFPKKQKESPERCALWLDQAL